MLGWHFIQDDQTVRRYVGPDGEAQPHGGAVVRPGQRLEVCGLIARGSVASHPTFARGLFASPMPADAVFHSPGMTVCRVHLSGKMLRHDHYAQAEARTCLWMADARQTVREWGCWCAATGIERARRADLTVEDCAEEAVKACWQWAQGQATELEVRRWLGRNRQAMRFHAGKDSRGKWSNLRAPGDPRLIHVYSLCTALCSGYLYHMCGIASRPSGWYDTPEGISENRKLEAMLLALQPKARSNDRA